MRQLVRILVKIMPNSINMLAVEEEQGQNPDGSQMMGNQGSATQGKEGSGNKVRDATHATYARLPAYKVNNNQIRLYLTNALGDMLQPPWGVPLGWGSYVAGVRLSGTPHPRSVSASRINHTAASSIPSQVVIKAVL
ncbi:MAG: hypothetical protein WDW38_003437 [Sanguina aurantia]